MRYLRTNTACRITVGPFFDKTDGITPETALTVTSCKLTMMVDSSDVPTLVIDAAPTASGGNNDMVHVTGDDAGFYDLELTAAQTNYLGRAMIAITDAATHCPVFHEFMIVPAVVYDAVILGTDLLDVSMTQISGDAQSATDLKDFADAGYDPATNKVEGVKLADTITTYTGNTVQTGDAYARLGAPAGASVSADVAAVKTQTAAIEVDTADIQTRIPAALVGGRMDADMGAISADATAADNLEAMLDGTGGVNLNIQQLISTCGDALPNIVLTGTGTADGISFTRSGSGNPFDAEFAAQIQQEATDALNAYDPPTNAEMVARTLLAADYATATALDAVDNFVDTEVSAIKAVTDKLDTALELDGVVYRYTVNALELAPTGGSAPTAADIADAVWNEAQADHVAAGSFGLIASEIADILVDTAEIGAAGAGLTNINLPNQTMDITGNITGNLSGSVGSVTGLTVANLDVAVSSRLATAGYTAPLDAAGVRTAVGLASANLDTQLSTIDTVVDAVKVKTDSLTFTVAGQVDANAESMNAAEILGNGTSGNLWRGE
jgi:hypothetical protein